MPSAPQVTVLKLLVSPQAKPGRNIDALIDATNAAETVVTLEAPDTVVISRPHILFAGKGTFQQIIHWTVEHAQKGTSCVEITVSAGCVTQKGSCIVVG